MALLAFERAGSASPPVLKKPIVVHHGTDAATLRRGPGQYRSSGPPGGPGIFAVAGHRTTYGAPFGRLDELVVGDLVHVTDRDGRQHTYRVVAQEVLEPSASWVLRDYPLGQGRPTLVLTTCHPRYSAAQRLVVFAELLATPPDQ